MLLALGSMLTVAGLALATPVGATAGGEPAGAESAIRQTRAATEAPRRVGIDVTQVSGLIDPPNASLIRDSVRDANERRSELLVIVLASGGTVDVGVDELVRTIRDSRVPIAIWVGPSGEAAKGGAAVLAQAAPVLSVANGSGIGPAYPESLDDPSATSRRQLTGRLETLAAENGRKPAGAAATVGRKLSAERALALGAIDLVEPTLGELIVSLDGIEVVTAAGAVELSTARVVGEGQDRRRESNQTVRFRKLGLIQQVQHTLTSPAIAYLLLMAGLCLIVFEFFTAAIGLAGAVGALAVVGAFVGFSHLPVQWWAVALLMVAIIGFSVDNQAGGTGAWTVIAVVCLLVGSIFLYGGSSRLDVAWWTTLLVIAGTVLFMLAAVPAAIRSRFSTPTVGREAMIGEMGVAEVDVDPDGVVRVRDALWRARTNRATPISAGEPARVIEVDGLVLEVEPEEGGARDHRERRHGDPES